MKSMMLRLLWLKVAIATARMSASLTRSLEKNDTRSWHTSGILRPWRC